MCREQQSVRRMPKSEQTHSPRGAAAPETLVFRGRFNPPVAPLHGLSSRAVEPDFVLLDNVEMIGTTAPEFPRLPVAAGADAEDASADAGAASAPEFPTLPEVGSIAGQDVGSAARCAQAVEAVALPLEDELDVCQGLNNAPAKCADCTEFFASEDGLCSLCARLARGEVVPAAALKRRDSMSEDTRADYDDKMLMVGAAVVGAGIGALAGALGAVAGAGAGAYAATRPSGDQVGDTARSAGRVVVQCGSQVQEVGGQFAPTVAETAQKLQSVATQKAREAKLDERAAAARARISSAAQSVDQSVRQVDERFDVSGQVQTAAAQLKACAKQTAAGASSLMRWAAARADNAAGAPAQQCQASRSELVGNEARPWQHETTEAHC